MVTLCLYSSFHIALNLISITLGGSGSIEKMDAGRRYVWQYNSHYVTQADEPSFDCQEISVTTSPLTSGRLTPQMAIPLIIIFGWKYNWTRDQQLSVLHQKLTKGKDNDIIY